MNFSKRKSNLPAFATAFGVIALTIAAIRGLTNSIARAAGAGLEVEVPFEIKALKTPGLVAPYFFQDKHGTMVVSDQAGGVYRVTFAGKVTRARGQDQDQESRRSCCRSCGIWLVRGQTCSCSRRGGMPRAVRGRANRQVRRGQHFRQTARRRRRPQCRDLGIRRGGVPFAGKLYAAVSGNATIYAIDSSGKASVFGTYNKPVVFELTTIQIPASSATRKRRVDAGRDAREGRLCVEGWPHQHRRGRRQNEGRHLPGRVHPPDGLRVVAFKFRLIRRRVDDRGHGQDRIGEQQRARRHRLSRREGHRASDSPRV